MKKTKPETDSLLRTPKPSKFGLKVRSIAMPHESLIKPEEKEEPKLELVEPVPAVESKPTVVPTNVPTYLPTVSKNQPIAPEKDFARLPNSIKRAVEAGHFPNSSLAIYLYLYSLTRGAIQPKRSVRVNKAKLLFGANLRAEKALLKNLAHLKSIGLVKITVFNGDHSGNEYEVFVPEEIEGDQPTYLPTKQPTYLPIKSTPVPTDQILVGRTVQSVENTGDSDDLRLSFKDTNTIDDDLTRKTRDFMRVNFGRELSEKEIDWSELTELIFSELVSAAKNTKSISNVSAFLTEHLRRRLSKPSLPDSLSGKVSGKLRGKSSGRETDFVTGESYEAEPLTEQARETLLATFRGKIENGKLDEVLALKENYTEMDWQWLKSNLGI